MRVFSSAYHSFYSDSDNHIPKGRVCVPFVFTTDSCCDNDNPMGKETNGMVRVLQNRHTPTRKLAFLSFPAL